jgi:hypothetical protein
MNPDHRPQAVDDDVGVGVVVVPEVVDPGEVEPLLESGEEASTSLVQVLRRMTME